MRAVVYLLDNSRKHARMARKSIEMLRRHSPDIKVACLTTHHGLFQTIDATGALILETDQGAIAIPAAEVFF